jgi:large subunit ribosomal protein L54
MKGLNYFKGKDDPVALKEEEYPEWLWRCLDAKHVEGQDGGEGAGDEFCMCFSFVLLAWAVF